MQKICNLSIILITSLLIVFNSPAREVTVEKVDAFSIHGSRAGEAGMFSLDLDGDNLDELVFSSFFNLNWSLQKYDGDEFKIFWQSDTYDNDITKLLLLPGGDSSNTLIVATSAGLIEFWDLDDLVKINSITIGQYIFDIDIADANNDGINEMSVLTADHLRLFNLDSLEQEYLIDNWESSESIAIGNVDSDADNEIIFSDGAVLSIVGEVETLEWLVRDSFPDHYNFGKKLFLFDVNQDSILDLVSSFKIYQATGRSGVGAYDIANKNVIWHIDESNVTTLQLADVNKDDVPEVVFGINQFGSLQIVDIYTRELLHNIGEGTGFYNMHIFDADGDLNMDVVYSSGYSSSSPDYIHIYSLADQTPIWKSEALLGFDSIQVEDVDGDGNKELVFPSRLNQREFSDIQGRVYALDAQSLTKAWTSPIGMLGEESYRGINDIAIADLDDDIQLEFVIATDYQGQGAIYIVDSNTFQIELEIVLDRSSRISKVLIEDVDGDSQVEIIATNQQTSTDSEGVFAYIISPLTGDTIWKSENLLPEWMNESDIRSAFAKGSDMVITNVDADDSLEILIAVDDLIIIDVATKAIDRLAFPDRRQNSTAAVTTIAVLDIDLDAKQDIFIGARNGVIAQANPADKAFYPVDVYCDVARSSNFEYSILALDTITNGFMAFTCASENTVNILNIYDKSVIWSADAGHINQQFSFSNGDIKIESGTQQYEMYVGSANKVSQFVISDDSLVNEAAAEGFTYLPKSEPQETPANDQSASSGGALSYLIFIMLLVGTLRNYSPKI